MNQFDNHQNLLTHVNVNDSRTSRQYITPNVMQVKVDSTTYDVFSPKRFKTEFS